MFISEQSWKNSSRFVRKEDAASTERRFIDFVSMFPTDCHRFSPDSNEANNSDIVF